MVHAIVRLHDGSSTGRAWLRSVVRSVQRGLVEWGLDVDVDGWFGADTRATIRRFQTRVGLATTGVADRATWNQLEPSVVSALKQWQPHVAAQLPTFRGDLDWVHDQEGHRGQAYWPGGVSGVTLDPGVDLGHANPDLIANLYRPLMNEIQYAALRRVCGIKGEEAARVLQADPALQSIRLTPDKAESVLPFAARNYWDKISRRFHVDRASTLPAVQTVLLSLAYNRGVGNSDLAVLTAPLEGERWAEIAELVGAMQQDHSLPGIPLRRQAEANLIRAELEYLSN